jgi:hypothetical protein
MKKIFSFVIVICLAICLTGCEQEGLKAFADTPAPLIAISEQQNLYYDIHTKIVYLIFNEYGGHRGYGFMSPYYADNGKPYIYENGELVKIP